MIAADETRYDPLIKYIINLSNLSWRNVYFIWREQKLNLEPAARCVDVNAAVNDLETSTSQQNAGLPNKFVNQKLQSLREMALSFTQ